MLQGVLSLSTSSTKKLAQNSPHMYKKEQETCTVAPQPYLEAEETKKQIGCQYSTTNGISVEKNPKP